MTPAVNHPVNSEINDRVKPVSWLASLLILFSFAGAYILIYRVLVPAFLRGSGQPYLDGYLWAWGTSMLAVLVLSLVLYAREGHPKTLKAFAERYRLARFPWIDLAWALAVLIVAFGFYLGLGFTARWLASIPLFGPVPLAPPELRPEATGSLTPGVFMGLPVKGQWWVVVVYLFGWIFNILGEEFFYRGWLLPRQALAFGKWAWLVNGTMFTFQHWMQAFNFLAIWPGALFMAWVVQRRGNTWIGILQHGLMNFSALILLVRWVIG